MSLRKQEAIEKVMEIEESLERDDRFQAIVTPSRYFVHEGPLKKRFGKFSRQLAGSKVYQFFLFNDILIYCEVKAIAALSKTKYKIKHILPLMELDVEEAKGVKADREFTLKCQKKEFVVCAATPEERGRCRCSCFRSFTLFVFVSFFSAFLL